jgi:glycosyltransferase involved in cell wall biosynthesis
VHPNPDPRRGPVRILTNLERFPESWSLPSGDHGTVRVCTRFAEFRAGLDTADVLLIDGDLALVYKLCACFAAFPWMRKPLVCVDLVLVYPATFRARLKCMVRKALLRRVDHFINYFRHSDGYAKFFGITPVRSSFIHFKPNVRHRFATVPNHGGDYVLCFGRSRRDYDTFFNAMEKLSLPAAIAEPDLGQLLTHGSRFTRPLDRLPPQMTILKDDGTQDSMLRIIAGARVVALPLVKESLTGGNSVYLDAMLLGKCVVISTGPGISDVLTDEALFVPPGDVDALAAAIRSVWDDDELRVQTAERGYRHALSLGGEPELRERTLTALMAWWRSRG